MRIGIIGGGQLAMMLCEAAEKLNFETVVLDPNPDCSSKHVCTELITTNYNDSEGLDKLARECDVVTYEFENVFVDGIDQINAKYHNVVQTSRPLTLSNDRLIEKQAAAKSGFKPAPFKAISSSLELSEFATEVGYPVVLKTRRFGYDGKGQVVINDASEIEGQVVAEIIKAGAIAEQMIDLDYELSVIVIRNLAGEMKFIPSPINTHINNILFTSTIEPQTEYREVNELVAQYIEYHDLVGIITVEVFVSRDGQIYFNEIAPRPHNSGHYSIEGCNHSQFEMHLRSICNLPLPEVTVAEQTMMINVLGQDYQFAKDWYQANKCDQLYFHDYFKTEAATNRKMAHITAVGSYAVELLNQYQLVIKERNE